jgi:hypothetical protein
VVARTSHRRLRRHHAPNSGRGGHRMDAVEIDAAEAAAVAPAAAREVG